MASPQFYRRFKDKIGVVTRSGEFSSGASENDGSPVSSLEKHSEQSQIFRKLKESASFAQLAARRVSPVKVCDFSPESKSGAQDALPRLASRSPFLPEIREKLPHKASLGKLNSRNHSTLPLSLVTNNSFTLKEKSREFHPYTIEDYKGLKKTPARLGGLGPATIGTETWVAARKVRDRRLAYSQALQPGRRV